MPQIRTSQWKKLERFLNRWAKDIEKDKFGPISGPNYHSQEAIEMMTELGMKRRNRRHNNQRRKAMAKRSKVLFFCFGIGIPLKVQQRLAKDVLALNRKRATISKKLLK